MQHGPNLEFWTVEVVKIVQNYLAQRIQLHRSHGDTDICLSVWQPISCWQRQGNIPKLHGKANKRKQMILNSAHLYSASSHSVLIRWADVELRKISRLIVRKVKQLAQASLSRVLVSCHVDISSTTPANRASAVFSQNWPRSSPWLWYTVKPLYEDHLWL